MLIRRAELEDGRLADVRLSGGRIAAIGELGPGDGEATVDAAGARLLPGLHDHHIHVAALAASLDSLPCGPPEVRDAEGLAERLRAPGAGWLRGIGYHESVAGLLDLAALDRMAPHRPVRIQHRGGRMWFLNSPALAALLEGAEPPPGLEREDGRFTGRLFDEDAWLTHALRGRMPGFAEVGRRLANLGVTGLTEISPRNDARIAAHFAAEQASGALPQRMLLAGRIDLSAADAAPTLRIGPVKLHLHEAALPELDRAVALAAAAHANGRAVAIHCATETELAFALALFQDAGARRGDRIEHASVAPDWAVAEIARLGLAVVTQPHFIAERGDAYRRDVEPEAQPHLYRLRAFLDAGAPLAAGSDAPYGRPDPWAGMAAAVDRRTAEGALMGGDEALTPEAALELYLRDPDDLAATRRIAVGAPADLCLLRKPWREARRHLSASLVRFTFSDGRRIDTLDDFADRDHTGLIHRVAPETKGLSLSI